MIPPLIAVVPPKSSDFSKIRTEAPSWAAARPAVRPAAPVPKMITSHCSVKIVLLCYCVTITRYRDNLMGFAWGLSK